MAEGYHEITYADGDKYAGLWNAGGKRHGIGVLKFADGSNYAGQFSNGLHNGYGCLSFTDGSKYEGQFIDGKFSGYGVFSKSDGLKIEGEFKDGKASGGGKVTFPDGTNGRPRQEGVFQDRKLVTAGKQAGVVRQAQEARQEGQKYAKEANDMKGPGK